MGNLGWMWIKLIWVWEKFKKSHVPIINTPYTPYIGKFKDTCRGFNMSYKCRVWVHRSGRLRQVSWEDWKEDKTWIDYSFSLGGQSSFLNQHRCQHLSDILTQGNSSHKYTLNPLMADYLFKIVLCWSFYPKKGEIEYVEGPFEKDWMFAEDLKELRIEIENFDEDDWRIEDMLKDK